MGGYGVCGVSVYTLRESRDLLQPQAQCLSQDTVRETCPSRDKQKGYLVSKTPPVQCIDWSIS